MTTPVSQPAPNRPAEHSFSYVADPPGLAELLDRLRPFDRIALDTEADSFYHYHEKVCLIQLSFDGRHFLVDPLSGLDIAPLLAILADKYLIIHDAGYDLRILHRQYGFVPRAGIFDTMPAAQLVGVARFGLADLLEQFLDISVPKKGQKSDWSRRPLEAFQMQYAVADTAWLAALADRLQDQLRDLGRLEWHRQSCENVISSAIQHKSEPRKDAWRITGTSRFGPRDLAFVRALWNWREKQARSADQPPFKILGNDPLLHLALSAAKHSGTAVENLMRLPRNCFGQRLLQLQQAVDEAAGLEQSDWPKPFRPETAPQPQYSKEKFEELRREVSEIAEKLGLTPSLLAPRAAMINLVLKKPKTIEEIAKIGSLLPWQAELIHPAMEKCL
jgi:ribonuclease D